MSGNYDLTDYERLRALVALGDNLDYDGVAELRRLVVALNREVDEAHALVGRLIGDPPPPDLLRRRQSQNRAQALLGDIWFELGTNAGMNNQAIGEWMVAKGTYLQQGHVPLLWIAEHDENDENDDSETPPIINPTQEV